MLCWLYGYSNSIMQVVNPKRIGRLLGRILANQVKPEGVIINVSRTQDPHHHFCGARLVIAHPHQKLPRQPLKVQVTPRIVGQSLKPATPSSFKKFKVNICRFAENVDDD
jgi:hypothetical protein